MNKKESSLINKTKKDLIGSDLFPKKSKGQNFMIDPFYIGEMVKAAHISPGDKIFEIGPGTGNLTIELAKTEADILAIEKDINLVTILENKFKDYKNVKIIHGDIEKANLPELLGESSCWKVVANLPYYITNHIILSLLEHKNLFNIIVLTIQKEVAERLTSPPGCKEYGTISLYANYYSETNLITIIPPYAFYPVPKVESAIISFTPRETPKVIVKDEKILFSLIRSAFNMRRKTLRNAVQKSTMNQWNNIEIDRILTEAHIDGTRRAETLSLEEFASLANLL